MKLSELLAADPVPERAFGVVVDTDVFDPPPGLREISFRAPLAGKGEIDNDVLDVLISYLISNVDVTVEIAAEDPIEEPPYLMSVAASIGFTLSFLPPLDGSDEAFERYVDRLVAFVPLYAAQPNFSKLIVPVTSYLEYLFVEAIDPAAAAVFAPTDPYVVDNFASVMPIERSDRLKARLRQAFVEFYGGEEAFLAFRLAIVGGICEDVEQKLGAEFAGAGAAGTEPDQTGMGA